jgi:hypothetical protein
MDEVILPIHLENEYPQRNEPCPCMSGKKYKHCHRDADESFEPCDVGFFDAD